MVKIFASLDSHQDFKSNKTIFNSEKLLKWTIIKNIRPENIKSVEISLNFDATVLMDAFMHILKLLQQRKSAFL